MTSTPKVILTPARRKALDVMRRAHPAMSRISNATAYATRSTPAYVYWQTARWLEDQALATPARRGEYEYLHLTPRGLALAHKVGTL